MQTWRHLHLFPWQPANNDIPGWDLDRPIVAFWQRNTVWLSVCNQALVCCCFESVNEAGSDAALTHITAPRLMKRLSASARLRHEIYYFCLLIRICSNTVYFWRYYQTPRGSVERLCCHITFFTSRHNLNLNVEAWFLVQKHWVVITSAGMLEWNTACTRSILIFIQHSCLFMKCFIVGSWHKSMSNLRSWSLCTFLL